MISVLLGKVERAKGRKGKRAKGQKSKRAKGRIGGESSIEVV